MNSVNMPDPSALDIIVNTTAILRVSIFEGFKRALNNESSVNILILGPLLRLVTSMFHAFTFWLLIAIHLNLNLLYFSNPHSYHYFISNGSFPKSFNSKYQILTLVLMGGKKLLVLIGGGVDSIHAILFVKTIEIVIRYGHFCDR